MKTFEQTRLELLDLIIETTRAIPEKEFDISRIYSDRKDYLNDFNYVHEINHGCGSVGCCFGWAILDPRVQKLVCTPKEISQEMPIYLDDVLSKFEVAFKYAHGDYDNQTVPAYIADAIFNGENETYRTFTGKTYHWHTPTEAADNLQQWRDELAQGDSK